MQCVGLHEQPLELHTGQQLAQRCDLTAGIGGVGALGVAARLLRRELATPRAKVLCVDEKTQIQGRTQPQLPMGARDYIRHGATPPFAALDVATGRVITQCKPHHRHQDFLGFLRQFEKSVPEDLDVHLVVDNYCTHKHAIVRS
jgi:hypothetical protein